MSTNTVTDKDLRPSSKGRALAPATSSARDVAATAAAQHVSPALRARGKARPLFEPAIVKRAVLESFRKLDPRHQARNPVMFVVEVGSLFTTVLWLQALGGAGEARPGFILAIALWLWFTVLFANFAEAMAEGRGKAQADTLRKARKDIPAKQLAEPREGAVANSVLASQLRKGTSSASKRATSSLPTARSSSASPRSTRAQSPARAPPSSARAGAIGARLRAGRASSPTGSSCG